MRLNSPALVNPMRDVQQRTSNTIGLPTLAQLASRIDAIETLIASMNKTSINQRSVASVINAVSALAYASPDVLTTVNVKGSITATNITSKSGTTITNGNITPVTGLRYLVIAFAALTLNAPAGQTIWSCTRIGASGSTIDGMQTATPSGERTGIAISVLEVIGNGASLNIAGRARVSGGTGTVNDAISAGIAIPLGALVEA